MTTVVASSSFSSVPFSEITSTSLGLPSVSVPVLSNASVFRTPKSSSGRPPLISTPPRAARATPLRTALGVEMANAQGLARSEEHTSELQSRGHLVCRLLLDKKKQTECEKSVHN